MAIAWATIRVGKKYRLTNFGEVSEFEVLEAFPDPDFKVKDLHTLEVFRMTDLIRYGKGKDYDLYELE